MGHRFVLVLGILGLLGISRLQAAPLNEGFETGDIPDTWTVVNQDGDAYAWEATDLYPHSGTYSARIHWNASGNDDWLITPPLVPTTGDVTFSFWARSRSSVFPETFQVLVSTTSPVPNAFHDTLATVQNVPSAYTQYTYDLSSYIGDTIYVAVRCISVDEFYLHVDDFTGPEMIPPPGVNIATTSLEVPGIVFPGEQVPASVVVTNTKSNTSGYFYEVFTVNGQRLDSTRLRLAGGEVDTLWFHYTASTTSTEDHLSAFCSGPADSIGSDAQDDTLFTRAPVTPLHTPPFYDDFSTGLGHWATGGTGAWQVRTHTQSLVGDSSMLLDRSVNNDLGYSEAWTAFEYSTSQGGLTCYYRLEDLETNETLSFWLSKDRGQTWHRLGSVPGNNDTTGWTRMPLDFTPYLGGGLGTDTLIFKVRGLMNYGYAGDGAFIDSVYADTLMPPIYNMAIDSILLPQPTVSGTLALYPAVLLRNLGNQYTTYLAYAWIRDRNNATIYGDTQWVTTPLAPGATDTVLYDSLMLGIAEPYRFYTRVNVLPANATTDVDSLDFMALRYIGTDFFAADLDPLRSSAYTWIRDLQDLGYAGSYTTNPQDVSWPGIKDYKMLWLSAGMFPNNWMPDTPQVAAIDSFLHNGGYSYMEGGDLWGYGPFRDNLCTLFGMNSSGVSDGSYGDTLYNRFDMVSNPWIPGADSIARAYTGQDPYIDYLTATPPPSASSWDTTATLGFGGTDTDTLAFPSMVGYHHYTASDQLLYKTVASSMQIGDFDTLATNRNREYRPSLRLVWSIVHDNFNIPPSQEPIVVLESPVLGIRRLTLRTPYPNPLHRRAWISFTLPQPAPVSLEVFDAAGRRVQTLLQRHPMAAGWHRIPYRAGRLPSGTYFLRLQAGTAVRVRKFVISR